MPELAESPFWSPLRCGKLRDFPSAVTSSIVKYRFLSSPPSPELDIPPILFIAIAIVSCDSGLSAPMDMPPVKNLLQISGMASTYSIGIGALALSNVNRSLRAVGGLFANSSS